jgi:hypothetical protein
MEKVERQILNALKIIEETHCSNSTSLNLEARTLLNIYEKNLITAVLSGPALKTGEYEFYDIKLTLDGQEYIESAKKSWRTIHSWHTNPFIIATLTFILVVMSAGLINWLGWK